MAAPAVGVPAAPTRWVTDGVGFLSPQTRASLDRRLEAYERRTGRQIVVWIGDTIGAEALEPWAARTFAAWGIGRRGKDDGAAIFVLARDRRVRIEVGYGLEGQLTDLQAARIIQEQMTPRLRRGDQDGAVSAAVSGVLRTLGGEDPALAPAVEPQPRTVGKGELVVLGVAALLFLLLLITNPALATALLFTMSSGGHRRGGMGWGGGGGGGFSGGGGRSGGGGASGSW